MFRQAGYEVHTKVEVFGHGRVPDVQWIQYADEMGWAALSKDDRIRRRPLEKHALAMSSLRVLCLPDGHLRAHLMAERFRTNLRAIEGRWRAAERPWVYAVHDGRLERLRIYPPE